MSKCVFYQPSTWLPGKRAALMEACCHFLTEDNLSRQLEIKHRDPKARAAGEAPSAAVPFQCGELKL